MNNEGNSNINKQQTEVLNLNNIDSQNQQVSNQVEKKPKDLRNLLIVILMLLSIALAALIIYDKGIKKDETQGEVISQETPSEKTNTSSNIGEVTVVDGYTNIEAWGTYKGKGVKVPKITGNSSAIAELNNKILVDSLETILNYKNALFQQIAEVEKNKIVVDKTGAALSYDCSQAYEYSYRHYKKNDILIIKIDSLEKQIFESDYQCISATADNVNNYEYYYFYDIKNDKALTFEEAAQKTNAKFASDSYCENYNALKDEENIELEIDNSGNMTISCTQGAV